MRIKELYGKLGIYMLSAVLIAGTAAPAFPAHAAEGNTTSEAAAESEPEAEMKAADRPRTAAKAAVTKAATARVTIAEAGIRPEAAPQSQAETA